MVVVETRWLTRQIIKLLSDDEYRQFQAWLMTNPDLGKRIPGSSGLRKIRIGLEGRGKRSGGTDHLLLASESRQDLLVGAYRKNELKNPSPAQLDQMVAMLAWSWMMNQERFNELLQSIREAGANTGAK